MVGLLSIIALTFVLTASPVVCDVVLCDEDPLPVVDLNEWWGPNSTKDTADTTIRPFEINFTTPLIDDLKFRLSTHRPFSPPLEGVNFTYGFNSNELNYWVKYWAEEYPFAEREKYLNQFPQYKTNIQGLDIHFIRVQSKNIGNKEVVPLLMLHGWPGSVREFYDTLPYILEGSEKRDFALDIIVPSLPGYGFSDGAVIPGLGVDKIAVVFRNLMNRIGYNRYYLQGGDAGAFIASDLATLFAEEVLGYHSNVLVNLSPEVIFNIFVGSQNPQSIARPEVVNRIYPLSKYLLGLADETGYLHIQATRPDTVGVGVSDSPAGLAAYIMDKFSSFSRRENKFYPDGRLRTLFTKYQLIDNLMIYWSSNCIVTSMRLYAETFNLRYLKLRLNEIVSPVPVYVIQAYGELFYLPPWLIKKKFPNYLNEIVLPDGGHFPALEKPKFFGESVLDAIDAFREWHSSQPDNEDS